jgi:hypothetical protein
MNLFKVLTKKFVKDGASQFQKFCARWVPKMLMSAHKMQKMASALTFLEQYREDSDKFLSHTVMGDETWVSFVNIETKEQSKQWMHTFTKQDKIHLNVCCQEADDSCFLGQERIAEGGIHVARDHNNVRSVLQKH